MKFIKGKPLPLKINAYIILENPNLRGVGFISLAGISNLPGAKAKRSIWILSIIMEPHLLVLLANGEWLTLFNVS